MRRGVYPLHRKFSLTRLKPAEIDLPFAFCSTYIYIYEMQITSVRTVIYTPLFIGHRPTKYNNHAAKERRRDWTRALLGS